MVLPYTVPKAVGVAADTDAPAELTHVVPLEVNTLPLVLGATKVGADAPLPRITLLAVRVVRLVPPLATGSVPVTPVDRGKPVRLVATPLVGVPSAGVVSVGEVSVLLVSVSVPAKVLSVPVVGNVTLVAAVSVRV